MGFLFPSIFDFLGSLVTSFGGDQKLLMLMRIEIFPFFNFANHNYHGVDVKKYYDALKAEDEATAARET